MMRAGGKWFVAGWAGWENGDVPVLRSVNVGRPKVRDWAGIGRTSIEKHAVTGPVAAPRAAWTATRCPTSSTTAVSTRPSTRSPARTSTAGSSRWAAHPRRPVRREPHHLGHRRQCGRGGGALGDRDRRARGGLGADPLQRLQELDGPEPATTTRRGSSGSPRWAGPVPTCASSWTEGVVQAGDEIRVVHRPGHGVTVGTMFRGADDRRELLPRAAAASTDWSREAARERREVRRDA